MYTEETRRDVLGGFSIFPPSRSTGAGTGRTLDLVERSGGPPVEPPSRVFLRGGRPGGDGNLGGVERPGEGIVRDFLPARLTEGVVRAAGEILVGRDRLRLALEGGGRLVDHDRGNVILATGDDEQGRTIVVAEIDLRR